MARKNDDRNVDQVIRKDGKGCFVEVLCDGYGFGKMHLQFATYDKTKPEGQRQTNNVQIYIDAPTFLALTEHIIRGSLQRKDDKTPFYEALGGTDAKYLNPKRADGKSQSRVFQIWPSNKGFFLTAMSGPGETQATGIITPLFGSNPENKVSVPLTVDDVEEIFLMTSVDYQAWRTAKHTMEWKDRQTRLGQRNNRDTHQQQTANGYASQQPPAPQPNNQPPANYQQQMPAPQLRNPTQPAGMFPQGQNNFNNVSPYGSINGTVNGSAGADDTKMF